MARIFLNAGTLLQPVWEEFVKPTEPIETLEQGFLNAILANPDDIAPRLVYADWLDEHEQPERAWLIREAPALKWWRRRYGKWFWEREYLSNQFNKKAYWNLFNDGELWNRCTRAAYQTFPQTWRRNLNTVIYRNGFVDELGVDRFHSNTFRLLETQPVRTVTTRAEDLLQVVDLFPARLPLRTIKLTTVPTNVLMMADGNLRAIRYSDVPKVIYLPNRSSDLVIAPEASLAEFYLKRIAEYYLTPRGITVELPATD